MPALRASSPARSSRSASTAFASLWSREERSAGATERQAGKAFLARRRRRRSPRRPPAELRHDLGRRRLEDLDHWAAACMRSRAPRRATRHPAALVLLRVPEHADREAPVGKLDRLDDAVVGPAGRDHPRRARRGPGGAPTSPRCARPPTTRSASEPGSSRTPWSVKAPGVWRWSSRPRCWFRVPPWITFSISIPRQIPSTGMSRAARVPSPISKRSRSASCPGSPDAAARRSSPGSMSDPPARISRRACRAARPRLGRDVVRRQDQREPARALDRERVGARREVHHDLPGGPLRALDRGADPDDRPSHHTTAGKAQPRSNMRRRS